MTAHIIAINNLKTALREATIIARKYGIYHSTIQVEPYFNNNNVKEGRYDIDCHNNIH